MNPRTRILITLISITLFNTATLGQSLGINITGNATGGDAFNPDVVINTFIAPGAHINQLGWDVWLETFGASWASEAMIGLGSTSNPLALVFAPGSGVENALPATTNYTSGGLFDLTISSQDFFLDLDGILVVTLFESLDDPGVDPDGIWWLGTLFNGILPPTDSILTFGFSIPGPGSFGLLAVAVVTTRGRRRRR